MLEDLFGRSVQADQFCSSLHDAQNAIDCAMLATYRLWPQGAMHLVQALEFDLTDLIGRLLE